MKTLQQAFDHVVNHLRSQGKRSLLHPSDENYPPTKTDDTDTCAYRSQDGKLMCAVGCLIDDKHYDPKIEGLALVCNDEAMEAIEKSGWPTDDQARNLYWELQHVHDGVPIKDWELFWEPIADDYNLIPPEKLS
jgi:hypothetical protein